DNHAETDTYAHAEQRFVEPSVSRNVSCCQVEGGAESPNSEGFSQTLQVQVGELFRNRINAGRSDNSSHPNARDHVGEQERDHWNYDQNSCTSISNWPYLLEQ